MSIINSKHKLESGFFGFRVKQWKFTMLMMVLIILGGIFAMVTIKKEATPDVEYGIVSITTIYQGASPEDIDDLITDPIEQEIKDVNGVKKITSTSSVGISSVMVELENDADTTQALVDIKDGVDKASLPSDAEDPIVNEISTNTERMFVVLLAGDTGQYDQRYLTEKAQILQDALEKYPEVDSVDIGGLPGIRNEQGGKKSADLFEITVLLDKAKMEQLGVSLGQVRQSIMSRNTNQPLGSHQVGERSYEFRIQGKFDRLEDLGKVVIPTHGEGMITLDQIAQIQKELISDEQRYLVTYGQTGSQHFVSLTVNKPKGANIFSSAKVAKKALTQELRKPIYDGLRTITVLDMAENIGNDYTKLSTNGLQTLLLVFVSLFLFVGWKESLIATISLPLAFFIAFIVLKWMGLSLNFLTNFSFIIAFGVAIDTTLVIIEGAHEKMKQGFNPKSAVLIAIRDYKAPVISGTATTVVVFVPLLTLPGVMGKFLSFIPITIFSTLVAALFIALTVIGALFYLLSRRSNTYAKEAVDPQYLPDDDRLLREDETKDKNETSQYARSRRERILERLENAYFRLLSFFFQTKTRRILTIVVPLVGLIVSINVLSSMIGFKLIPDQDKDMLTLRVETLRGTDINVTQDRIFGLTNQSGETINDIFASIPEIKVAYFAINGHTLNGTIELFPLLQREKQGQRNAFMLERELNDRLLFLQEHGLKLVLSVPANGPPSGDPISIKLHTRDNQQFNQLLQVAEDFKHFLQSLPGTKNVAISSDATPGQFVYHFINQALYVLGLNPLDFQSALYATTNGIGAGSMKLGRDDMDITLDYKQVKDVMTPNDLDNVILTTKAGKVQLGSVSDVSFVSAVDSISREDTDITVSVGAEALEGIAPDSLQQQLVAFAQNYQFPQGMNFSSGGEQADNADLIQAMMVAFVISLLTIFAILVLQFNSYSQPIIIMFSVVMGLFGANLGLVLTGNNYGMMFGIGFIALTGIVVNDAIVYIDKANRNVRAGMKLKQAVLHAGKSRLQPIILTTLTTVLGLASIVSDAMFQPLAVTVMSGLTVASVMTLFVIPVIYYQVETLKKRRKRTKSK